MSPLEQGLGTGESIIVELFDNGYQLRILEISGSLPGDLHGYVFEQGGAR